MREAAYRLSQDLLSAWLARRHAGALAGVERFCLFAGYPRSGHSLVGALLNAHPDAVVSHELDVSPLVLAGCGRDELYARILARAWWFHLRGDRSNYPYRVPGQWQGRFARLKVIGDKRGGAVTRCLAEHPDLLDRVRALTGAALRVLHVVRNPFDNVAAISIWERWPLERSADWYFMHCATTARLASLCAPDELVTLRHEQMVADPAGTLRALCRALSLDAQAGWLRDCCAVVFPSATCTRRRVAWPAALRRSVEERARAFPHLAGYAFDEGGVMRTSSA